MEVTEKENSNENSTNLIWKLSIGSILSWELSKAFGSAHPYLAPLSVILTLQSTIDKTVNLSIKRVIGTMIGIFVTVLIADYLPLEGWSLGILILIGCYITKIMKFDKKVIHQVALTILFVFVFEHQSKNYAIDRLRDTLVGVLVAGVIQLVWFRLVYRKNVY
jgi:uncharacterized membrane protein YgaE (UPF0421/DUF939 family)